MSTSSEPNDQFQTKLAAVAGLSAIVGSRVGQEWPANNAVFPAVAWKKAAAAQAKTDAESWLGKRTLIQVDLLGDDFDVLVDLADLVDAGINDACNDGSWDTTHWKCNTVRRVGEWKRLDWEDRQTATGNNLIQYTADFRVVFNRQQNVA